MTNSMTISKMPVRKKIAIVAAVLVLAALAGWLASEYLFSPQEKPLIEGPGRQDSQDFSTVPPAEIKVPVTVFYPGNTGLTKEERTVSGSSLPVKLSESILQEYFTGSKNGLKNTVVRGVYKDRNKILYVDLSDEFRRNFPGEARYEYYLLKSLYQTLAANVPEVKDVKILVEGREIDSAGGHMLTLFPLKESVWY